MNYEAWRATFQSSEQAAKAAFEDARKHHEMLLNTLTRCNELDANLQRIIEAATAEGPGPLTQVAIKEMPAVSLNELIECKQAEAVNEFAKEVWEEIFKHYRNVKVFPLTMAKQWIENRAAGNECSECDGLGQIAKVTCPICDGRGKTRLRCTGGGQ
ncbi:hypothetical protein [Vreelandella alkaliphila]|uniref:Uncharacterized protein n=1 Tax=Vreelandella alkaliphila TaxID=272774 RepID=A0A7C9JWP7_9GAMM|nr:hypothetical protein [Halomonas alkaliphila]NDL70538.1 hypothetical protein [Halomonas alkaliphila]